MLEMLVWKDFDAPAGTDHDRGSGHPGKGPARSTGLAPVRPQ
ncbi:MAG: hypothetical protein ABWY11_06380 [Umezawaea sp.]